MLNPAPLQCQFIPTPEGRRIATISQEGASPRVIFLCGHRSDMRGVKAAHLAQWASARGQAYTRFDYSGHGESGGVFEEGTIGSWLEDALAVIDATSGPLILAGSSMGGWIGLLAALKRPERVVGFLGIAAAPDFTEALIWDKLTDQQQKQLVRKGFLDLPSRYEDTPLRITVPFLEESSEHFLLDKPSIPLRCPVTLLHGLNDLEVPFEFSMALNEKIESKRVSTKLIPDGDHRLSSEKHLGIIVSALEKLLVTVGEVA